MTTDNKKISAYVPDVVYDRFIQYKDEYKLSMSQAAIEIFAAYFGINLNPTIFNESTGELLSRVSTLEKELSGLKTYLKLLSERVDLIQSTSEPLINKPLEVLVDKGIDSELDSSSEDRPLKEDIIEQPIDANIIDESKSSSDSELPIIEPLEILVDKDIDSKSDSSLHGELPKEDIVEQSVDISIVDKPESGLDSEPPKQLQLIDSSDLLSELKSNPLEGKVLVLRLNKVTTPTLSVKKSELLLISSEAFYDWLQAKDINGIRWVLVGEGRKARYVPADDTPVEKLQLLKNWIQDHT
jgi:hypothetical protein